MKRRDFLKSCSLATAGLAFAPTQFEAFAAEAARLDEKKAESINEIDLPIRSIRADISKPITIAVIGAGGRGNVYAGYARKYPDLVKVVAVSDINDYRLKKMSDEFKIPQERRFGHYREILAAGKLADAVVIATPDDRHYEPCMKALELGYHVLVEKPIAQTEKQCRDILAMAKKSGRVVGTCHVLRYAPYFIAMREMINNGSIGKVVSIQHMEPICFSHMAHSYVRGNWRNSKETTPIILAKSCHDLDILRWWIGKSCKTICADGSLTLFRSENAPEGAPMKCTDGCPHEATCPYSALDIYLRRKNYNFVFDIPDRNDLTAVREQLVKGPYGRCVYHCDNDQPDHYVANMVFEDGITASFTMDAFTPWGGRRTRVMGTTGFIEGDGKKFTVYDFRSDKKMVWNKDVSNIPEYAHAGHGGGDLSLFRDFVEAVAAEDPGKLSSTIDVSMESHIMGFAAEKSRKNGRKVKVSVPQ